MPSLAKPSIPPDNTGTLKTALPAFAKANISLIRDLWHKARHEPRPATQLQTHEDAAAFLNDAIPKAKLMLGRPDALTGPINDMDGLLLLRAIAVELQKQKLR
jgi:hypothetical protein